MLGFLTNFFIAAGSALAFTLGVWFLLELLGRIAGR